MTKTSSQPHQTEQHSVVTRIHPTAGDSEGMKSPKCEKSDNRPDGVYPPYHIIINITQAPAEESKQSGKFNWPWISVIAILALAFLSKQPGGLEVVKAILDIAKALLDKP